MQRDLVVELDLIRRQRGRQTRNRVGIFTIILTARYALRQRNPVQKAGQVAQSLRERKAAQRHLVGDRQQASCIARSKRIEHAHQQRGVDRAEHRAHRLQSHLAGAVGNRLIKQRQPVAHRPACRVTQHAQRRRLGLDPLVANDRPQVPGHGRRRHLLEVELQAAAEHRDRHLLRIGGSQDEAHVVRRLFERLEHRVERMLGQHVHFVDHVDLVARIAGRIGCALQQRHHVVDAAVAGRVHLDVVDEAAGVDRQAGFAHIARRRRHIAAAIGSGAVQRLGEDARQRGLADTARSGEQIRVMKLLARQRMAERAHHVVLTDQRGEIARAPLAREDLIRHGGESSARPRSGGSLAFPSRLAGQSA